MLEGLKNAPAAIWMFVLVGILAGVGVLVNSEFQDNGITKYNSITTNNETITSPSNSNAVNLANPSVILPTTITVTNESNGETLATDEFNVTLIGLDTIEFWLLRDINNYTKVNITYTSYHYTQQWNTIENSTLGIINITKQLPTVGTVIGVLLIVAVIVGLVGAFTFFRRGREAY